MKKDIKTLVVEDDNDINKLLCDMLNMSGYSTKSAYSGTEALIYLEQGNWDMVLLDLMLPGMNGEELLVKIREISHMPVVIISAKEETNVKIETLRIGADDFITKPFDIDEVSARIDSHLRRYKEFSEDTYENILSYREISLNKDTREVLVNNTNVILTTREFDILQLFMSYPKKVFSKSNVFESVWGNEYICDDNTITVHISNLRNKLSKAGAGDYIQTVWGIGYKLDS
ncbi:response regulator transcription factor [Clostridium sp. P21]|uniref:Stage 0 sporulation protein A homolog n=1 Tax=Clostridium muellerianum TaxID=2716538 RepID=A0A7Y0HNS9_9CLOT|nr:response regulator transcription factor [Clostridium muellerianum]NMM62972.1 response regulator transcription factor [Clostridium muellerianum]